MSRNVMKVACLLTVLSAAGLWTASAAIRPDVHGFIAAQPEELAPPPGSIETKILGDPRKPGPYVIRLTFAPGQGSRPHYHDKARYITVIKGTWWVSLGPQADVYDPAQMKPMKSGSFLYEPAYGHHYDMAKDEPVTVQIMGMGPVKTTRIARGGAHRSAAGGR